MGDALLHGGDIYRNKVQQDFSVNINPLGMPGSVREAIRKSADRCALYPDVRYEALREAIGDFYEVPAERIICGNGSSELIMAVVHALKPKKSVIPVPSFYGYERAALSSDGEIVYFSMSGGTGDAVSGDSEPSFSAAQDFHFTEARLRQLKGILTSDVSMLFMANPNNPDGSCIRPDFLGELLDHCRERGIVVVLDECFLEFAEDGRQRSRLAETERWPNLIVLRAFTKILAMPGVRLGWLACADRWTLESIGRQLPEWNVSVPAQQSGMAAVEALRETDYLEETVRIVKRERDFLSRSLQRMGLRVYTSEADFLLFFSEMPLYDPLLSRGILIRDCRNFRELEAGYYRIAVKKREENALLLAAIGEILQAAREIAPR